ncbi:hypothetical protein QFZ23_002275 [Arthrobacter globiformis]|nr:hypothetical protein [Arthrobacter globiformis]
MLDHEFPATMPADGDTTPSNSGAEAIPVTPREPPPNLWPDHLGGQVPARLPAARTPVGSTAGGEIIRCQVHHLIREILNDSTVKEDVRLGLLRNLAEHPGNPEQTREGLGRARGRRGPGTGWTGVHPPSDAGL